MRISTSCSTWLLLFSVTILSLVFSVASSCTKWRQANLHCAPEDTKLAIHRFLVNTELECVLRTSWKELKGVVIVHFSSVTRNCLVFEFQAVCRSLIPGKSPNCAVFIRFPIGYGKLNPKLNNVWLAHDSSRLENLVCQTDPDMNRLTPVGVQWSSEGATFDGISSYAVINKSNIDFTTGLTWLLRIKRQQRQHQPLFEFNDCSTLGSFTMYGTHIWEIGTGGQLAIRRCQVTGVKLSNLHTPGILPAGSGHWVNIGFTSTASGDSFDVFYMDSFLPRASLTVLNEDENHIINATCLYFGMRVASPTNMFNGTLKALALANVSMTESEIREFFDLVKD